MQIERVQFTDKIGKWKMEEKGCGVGLGHGRIGIRVRFYLSFRVACMQSMDIEASVYE